MGCKVQVLQDPVCVNVKQNMDCCCKDIITKVNDIELEMNQINVTILRGKVICISGDKNTPVKGAIVVATDPYGNHFVGITNCDGEYSICVPLPKVAPPIIPHGGEKGIKYEVQAYYCSSCNGPYSKDTECTCSPKVPKRDGEE